MDGGMEWIKLDGWNGGETINKHELIEVMV